MSPEAKRLLEGARAADVLGASARDRMLQGLAHKIARGEAALPGIDAAPPIVREASWLAKLMSSALGKLGLGALGALFIAGGVLLLRDTPRSRSVAVEAPGLAAVPLDQPAALPPPPAVEPAREAAPVVAVTMPKAAPPQRERRLRERRAPSPEPQAQLEPATRVAQATTLSDEPAPEAEPEPEPKPEPELKPEPVSTLDDELLLLRRAYSELNAGRAERAFEVLDAHAERFPRGELEEAREVARMLALCAMDREPAARVRAKHFLATRPDSPFAGRVRGICPPAKKRDTDPR